MSNPSIVELENQVLRDRLATIKKAVGVFIKDVERYVEPKPGDEYLHRMELLNEKNDLKTLLK